MPPRILLTGATGCIGRAVLDAASRGVAECEIVGVHRSTEPPRIAGASMWLRADLADLPSALPRAGHLDGCIHAAALVHQPHAEAQAFEALNVAATVRLARALVHLTGFRRFVFVSSVAAAEETTPYGTSKRRAEEALASVAGEPGLEVSSLRLATVYGRHDHGNIAALFRAIAAGRYLRVAPGNVLKSLISAEAAAAALLTAATSPGAPPLAIVADPQPYSMLEIENALAEAAGVPQPRRLPGVAALLAAAAGSAAERLLGLRAPLNMDRLSTLRRSAVHLPGPESAPLQAARAWAPASLTEGFRSAYASS